MDKKQSLLLVLLTAAISGFSIYMNKFAVKGIDTGIFTFSRNVAVSIFLLSTIVFISGWSEFRRLSIKDWLSLSIIGLVGGSAPFVLYFTGLQITSAASASLIHKSMFILVFMLSFIFFRERVGWKIMLAAASLLIGNYLIIRPEFYLNQGDVLILIATMLWAAENTYSKYVLKTLSGNIVGFGRMFFGSFFLLAYLLATGKAGNLAIMTVPQLGWVLVSSGVLFLYVLTWYNGLKGVEVSLATAILLLGSPFTTLLNFSSLSLIGLPQIVGNILIIAGIAYLVVAYNGSLFRIGVAWKKKTAA